MNGIVKVYDSSMGTDLLSGMMDRITLSSLWSWTKA